MSVEKQAAKFLIHKREGYHEASTKLKRKIAGTYKIGIGTFDLVKLPKQISLAPLDELQDSSLRRAILIEIKSTARDIGEDLKGFFFGFTYSEQLTAQKLKSKYKLAFVVLPKSGKKRFYL